MPVDHLIQEPQEPLPRYVVIILFADSCGGQSRSLKGKGEGQHLPRCCGIAQAAGLHSSYGYPQRMTKIHHVQYLDTYVVTSSFTYMFTLLHDTII